MIDSDVDSCQSQNDETPRKRQKREEPIISPCDSSNSNSASQNSKVSNLAGELADLHLKLSQSTAIASKFRQKVKKIGEVLEGEATNLGMEVEVQKEMIKLVEVRLAQELQNSQQDDQFRDAFEPGESQLKSRINERIRKLLKDKSRSSPTTSSSPKSQEIQTEFEMKLAIAEGRMKIELLDIMDDDWAFQGFEDSVLEESGETSPRVNLVGPFFKYEASLSLSVEEGEDVDQVIKMFESGKESGRSVNPGSSFASLSMTVQKDELDPMMKVFESGKDAVPTVNPESLLLKNEAPLSLIVQEDEVSPMMKTFESGNDPNSTINPASLLLENETTLSLTIQENKVDPMMKTFESGNDPMSTINPVSLLLNNEAPISLTVQNDEEDQMMKVIDSGMLPVSTIYPANLFLKNEPLSLTVQDDEVDQMMEVLESGKDPVPRINSASSFLEYKPSLSATVQVHQEEDQLMKEYASGEDPTPPALAPTLLHLKKSQAIFNDKIDELRLKFDDVRKNHEKVIEILKEVKREKKVEKIHADEGSIKMSIDDLKVPVKVLLDGSDVVPVKGLLDEADEVPVKGLFDELDEVAVEVEVRFDESDNAQETKPSQEEPSNPSNPEPNSDNQSPHQAEPITIRVSDYCVRVSDSRWLEIDWKAHYTHKFGSKFVCNECSLVTSTSVIMQDHIWLVHYGGTFKCALCPDSGHTLSRRYSIGQHVKSKHSDALSMQTPGGTRRRSKYLNRESGPQRKSKRLSSPK